jgi:predicted dehydrogenase
VDPVTTVREQVAADCGTRSFADHHQLLDRVDGAVIATPTSLHHAVGLDFLRRGIAVLIEKPLAGTLAQADDLVKTAHRHNAILQVGHIERFNPALTAALPHLREPKYIEAVRASSFTFRSTDIGVVLDLMIHDLDVVLALIGAPVRRVDALGLSIVGRHEDVAQARLEFDSGCVVNLSASRVSSTLKRQMLVWSPQSFAAIDFDRRTASVTRPSETLLRRELDIEAISSDERLRLKDCLHQEHLPVEHLTVESRNALADELQDFAQAIRTAGTPRVSGQHARDVVAVAEQILAQIATHAWHGRPDGPVGPLATAGPPILRGPHWDRAPKSLPARREAG